MRAWITLWVMSLLLPISHAAARPLSDEPGRVLYQVYVETFQDGALRDGAGDFAGLESRLDYLQDLGVTALMLMPVFEGAGMGYSAHDFRQLRRDYGASADPAAREDALRRLIASAHARGIKVILDLPVNHISESSDWFRASEARLPGFEDFFVWSNLPKPGWKIPWDAASGPSDVWHFSAKRGQYYYALFGRGMPDLNHRAPEVQDAVLGLMRKYADLGADGYRIDAAKHFVEGSENNLDPVLPENRAMLRHYLRELRATHPGQSFLLEAWSNRYEEFEPYLPDSGDIAFDFAYMETLRDSVKHRHPWAVRNALKHLEDVQGRLTPGNRIVFAGNHDVARIRTVVENDRARAEIALATTFALPFTPMIYYGDEIFMPGDYIRSSLPGKTRNEVCTPMAWNAGPNAGFADPSIPLGDAWNRRLHDDYPAYNVASQLADPGSYLNFVRELIRVRKSLGVTNAARFRVDAREPSDPVLKIGMRLEDGRCVTALLNY